MHSVTTIGLDIAKSVFQVHGVDAAGRSGDQDTPHVPSHAYRTGRYTGEARAERQAARALIRELSGLIDAGK